MEGKLVKNSIGRWEIRNQEGQRWELTSGDLCEVLVGGEAGAWFRTRIEHNGEDYYATLPGVKLYSGMPARSV